MRKPGFRGPRGRVVGWTHTSRVLRANPLRDPHRRTIAVYLPPGYDEERAHYPLLVDLVGFTGSGASHLNWQPFSESLPERLDRLIHERRMGKVLVAFPDCFTRLGGNQYINSRGVGRYLDYLIDEVVPDVERRCRVAPGRVHRACFGKSSGGYGAMLHGMLRPDAWNAIACHSGDMYFDFCYRMDAPRVIDSLARHRSSPARFLRAFAGKLKVSDADVHTLMFLAMAATYDPAPQEPFGVRLPFDLHTGEWIESRWRRWLAHDPIHLLARTAKNLRKLALVYVDCGSRDQYHLHFGARILHGRLQRARVAHVFREFDDDHSKIDYRMDVSLPLLERAVRL